MIGYIKKYGVEIILILAYIGIMSLVAREKSLEDRSERYNRL